MITSVQTLLAHVKWFNSGEVAAEPGLNSIELGVVCTLVAVGLVVFWAAHRVLAKAGTTKRLDEFFKPYRALVPLIVRISTATLLLINLLHGYLLAPNVLATDSLASSLAQGLFVVAAFLIALGMYTERGALVLIAGYLFVFADASFVEVLDHVEYLAIAGYLLFRGPGLYSIDRKILKRSNPLAAYRHWSLPIYRIGIGVDIAILSLSEKLFNVSIAQDFLNNYHWNFLSFIGITDRNFIIVAGVVELAVGLALIFNFASRLTTLTVLGLMTLTAILLGIEEVYGHLFAVGAVAAIWVNDRKPLKNS